MQWVGIDEAGYGPNLGPMVMTAVVAEGPGPSRPDVWADRPGRIDRAHGDPACLWIDDSKILHACRDGLARLESSTCAAVGLQERATASRLLSALSAGTLETVEWNRWLEPGDDPAWPRSGGPGGCLGDDGWRIVRVRSVVLGPERFNQWLSQSRTKAEVHFRAFSELLGAVWMGLDHGETAEVRGDKHGGRHFYLEPLSAAFPDAWIDRGPEGPARSAYVMRGEGRRLELELVPKADANDGLVALASIVSKCVREAWMADFNAFWQARIADLRPTAGYPTDARRFRLAIEREAKALELPPTLWWRER